MSRFWEVGFYSIYKRRKQLIPYLCTRKIRTAKSGLGYISNVILLHSYLITHSKSGRDDAPLPLRDMASATLFANSLLQIGIFHCLVWPIETHICANTDNEINPKGCMCPTGVSTNSNTDSHSGRSRTSPNPCFSNT